MADAEQRKVLPERNVAQPDATLNFTEAFYRLVEKIWIPILCAVIGAGLLGVYSYNSVDLYEATSKVYVLSSSDSMINLSDLQLGSSLASDYVEFFRIWEVNQEVVDNLNLPYSWSQAASMVSVRQPANTRILYISVISTDPEESALIANEYASVFRDYVAKTMNTDKPQIMSSALPPTFPVNSNGVRNIAFGLMGGLLLGVVIVVLMLIADDKLKTSDDILRVTGLPTLASIPKESGIKDDIANMTKRRTKA